MIGKFFLILCVVTLIETKRHPNEETGILVMQYFSKKELIWGYLRNILTFSKKIQKSVPREYLGKCMYANESGHFISRIIEFLDDNMKKLLINFSENIDLVTEIENIFYIHESERDPVQEEKNIYFIDIPNTYPTPITGIIGLYENSKRLQNQTYHQLNNLKNFVHSVDNVKPNLIDHLNEHANRFYKTAENASEFARGIAEMVTKNISTNIGELDCPEKIATVNQNVSGMVHAMNLMEMRGLHTAIHAAWIELLLGDDKYFRNLNLLMTQIRKRIAQYYEIQDDVMLYELPLMLDDCIEVRER